MTTEYLGEETLESLKGTEFENYTQSDWAMYFVGRYGQIDGDWHKTWVLDQVARLLNGTGVVVKLARWTDGQSEYRVTTADPPSAQYAKWVQDMLGELIKEDGEEYYEYSYDVGIPP